MAPYWTFESYNVWPPKANTYYLILHAVNTAEVLFLCTVQTVDVLFLHAIHTSQELFLIAIHTKELLLPRSIHTAEMLFLRAVQFEKVIIGGMGKSSCDIKAKQMHLYSL